MDQSNWQDIRQDTVPLAVLAARALRFPGQWFQAESGLHQNWHRDYDPTTGRYVQPDPLGLVDGASVYGYARQSSLRYTDPKGLAVCGGICAGIGLGIIIRVCARTVARSIAKDAAKLGAKGVRVVITSECDEGGSCSDCHFHHLTPQYLGGGAMPQAVISASKHAGRGALHSMMRRFMRENASCRKCINGEDRSMNYSRGWRGVDIILAFSKDEIRECLCNFYRSISNYHPEISKAFFETHDCP